MEFKKVTRELIEQYADDGIRATDYLTESVSRALNCAKRRLRDGLEFAVVDCESPIEQMLSIELETAQRQGKFDIPLLVDVIGFEKQKIIVCGDKKYRADIAIPVKYWNGFKMFLIECDGYEFHQKTKEQVAKDNERMRDLQLAGYIIIRFSGSEIYHKAPRCACEIANIIKAPALKFIERMIGNEQSE
jgi:very-short-patch-repair endonuclease